MLRLPALQVSTEERLPGGDGHSIWVHAERLVHRLIPFNDLQRRAVDLVRQLIWWFYADLKAYKRDPCRKRAAVSSSG